MQPVQESTGAPLPRDHVGSLARGLAVLEALAAAPAGLTLSETAAHCGLTRAGARRLLITLVASGHAEQEGRNFRMSPRLLSLARRWLDGSPLWTSALGPMRRLADELGEACSAAVLAHDEIVYVARVPGARIVSVDLHVGTRLPAYCTSMGRVLLAGLAPAEFQARLAAMAPRPLTPKTITDAARLSERVAAARRQGYAVVDEELELGLRSLAVPVRDRAGTVVAALNVSTQASRYEVVDLERQVLPRLAEAAHQIEDLVALQ